MDEMEGYLSLPIISEALGMKASRSGPPQIALPLPLQRVQPNTGGIYHYHNFGRKSRGSIRVSARLHWGLGTHCEAGSTTSQAYRAARTHTHKHTHACRHMCTNTHAYMHLCVYVGPDHDEQMRHKMLL